MENTLIKILEIVNNHHISLTENDVFNLLQIQKRWPLKYMWNQPSVEIISEFGFNTSVDFFDYNGQFLYDRWKRCYDSGFTTIMSNIMDLTPQLRDLNQKIFEYTGDNINGNFYFSSGSIKNRVSFPPHKHEYNVIIKPIYGKSIWQIEDTLFENSMESFIIPMGVSHSVKKCYDKKLSLTLNFI